MFAVAEMREVKSAEEVAQMEDAFHIGYAMHTTAMRMCRAGVVEREIAGAIEGVAKSMGLGVSFPSIVSQHGETLHNLNSEGVLADGRLLLVDAGGENRMNYCSDHTRTYPVSGRFTAQQREIYDIVLACHDHIARIVRPGMMYMQEVHLEAYRKLAEGLVGVGLLKGSADDAVAAGAMYLFMPHGLGHGLGMDVHDCENIGERSFDYSLVAERAAQSATCLHRATWRLRPGTILSCCCWRASPASIPHRRLPSARSSPSPRSAWRDCRNGTPTSIVRRSLFRGCARRFLTASHAAGRHLPEPRWRTWRGRRSSPSLRRWAYRPPRCVPSPTAWENPSACGA